MDIRCEINRQVQRTGKSQVHRVLSHRDARLNFLGAFLWCRSTMVYKIYYVRIISTTLLSVPRGNQGKVLERIHYAREFGMMEYRILASIGILIGEAIPTDFL